MVQKPAIIDIQITQRVKYALWYAAPCPNDYGQHFSWLYFEMCCKYVHYCSIFLHFAILQVTYVLVADCYIDHVDTSQVDRHQIRF